MGRVRGLFDAVLFVVETRRWALVAGAAAVVVVAAAAGVLLFGWGGSSSGSAAVSDGDDGSLPASAVEVTLPPLPEDEAPVVDLVFRELTEPGAVVADLLGPDASVEVLAGIEDTEFSVAVGERASSDECVLVGSDVLLVAFVCDSAGERFGAPVVVSVGGVVVDGEPSTATVVVHRFDVDLPVGASVTFVSGGSEGTFEPVGRYAVFAFDGHPSEMVVDASVVLRDVDGVVVDSVAAFPRG